MYTFTWFDGETNKALNHAIQLAGELGHAEVGTEHLLTSLLCVGKPADSDTIPQEKRLREYLETHCGRGDARRLGPDDFSDELSMILADFHKDKRTVGWKRPKIGSRQLLDKLLSGKTAAAKMAVDLQITLKSAEKPQSSAGEPKANNIVRGKNLERYGKNLTQLARQNQLDPCIGREDEVRRLIQILCRRQKNNPCLLGEPGVGKTALVEGLAQRIAMDAVPLPLRYKQVFSLDLASVVAGTKYRGDFEERIRGILDEVSASRNIILFIDEVHTIVGAGAAEGAVDAANILKPLLARGGFRLIGATTPAEYHRCIEKDSALERRFQQVLLEEPDREKTLCILKGLRPRYEEFHKLKISESALEAAVDCSIRYIHDRYLPDKAVDLLDEAASCCVVEGTEDASVRKILEGKHILLTAARWAGMPVEQLTMTEKQRLLSLEEELHQSLVGQEEAVRAVASAVRRFRLGFEDSVRPNGSFLFLGPTGVGKTLLAKILARQLFGAEKLLFRFDMSEYNEPHSVSRLIGAPPGYVGYERSGLLTGAVHRHPYSIVLFDELEKAHPEVMRLLLQILEEGELTDNDGRRVDFRHTIVIATSNLGVRQDGWAAAQMGFLTQRSGEQIPPQVLQILSPELVNRFDEIIRFNKLDKEALKKIAICHLDQFALHMKEKGIEFTYTEEGVQCLVDKCWQPEYGARPIRRGIKTFVEDPLCLELLQAADGKTEKVVLDAGATEPQLVFSDAVCIG